METTIKKMNPSPVSTYRWLGMNDYTLDKEQFHSKKDHTQIKVTGEEQIKVLSINNKKDYLPSRAPMGEEFRTYVDGQVEGLKQVIVDQSCEEPIIYDYTLNNESLYEKSEIIFEKDVDATLIFIYRGIGTHMGIQEITTHPGSKGTVIHIHLLENQSLEALETIVAAKKDSKVNVISVLMGDDRIIDNINIQLEDKAKGNIQGLYLQGGNSQLDMNYVLTHVGELSESNMDIKGVLDDQAKKTFRGSIDFKKGASHSKGREKEEVLLLSEQVRNKAMPLILCAEDDVSGEHAASCGRIDEDKLFYLMSRGFSMEHSKRMIVEGSFHPILDLIPSEIVVEELIDMIQRRMS
ncbi:MAG TPA: SufD family Fe-S cluster assembly protein [Candidatus Merdenecus merdavium]|nr:SufD family Fe-S cluster assembly protein [Candidatus Merdenecus merdavium]